MDFRSAFPDDLDLISGYDIIFLDIELGDLIANTLGAAIGYIVVKLVIVPAISAVLASRSKKKDQEDASSRKDRNGGGTQGK